MAVRLTPSSLSQAGTSWISRYSGNPEAKPVAMHMSMRRSSNCCHSDSPTTSVGLCKSVTEIIELQGQIYITLFQSCHGRLQVITFFTSDAHFVVIDLALHFQFSFL